MKEIKICLLWHNLNSTNYGVGALAISQIDIIVKLCQELKIKPIITTFGTKSIQSLNVKKNIEDKYNIKIIHVDFNLKSLVKNMVKLDFSLVNDLSKFDLIIDVGEGDSFTDIYGWKRFINMTTTKVAALMSGKSLVLAPQTIGPFKRRSTAIIARSILSKCSLVFSRDYKTSDYLSDKKINYLQVSDLAFALPYKRSKIIPSSIGVNVSGLLWNGGYSRKNQFDMGLDYQAEIKKLIELFLKNGNEVHLISHVIDDDMEVEDDFRACIEVANYFCDKKVVVAPKFEDPIEVKSYISNLEFFTGSRMHATIAAVSSGVPCVPIAYSRKFSGVFGTIGYEHTIDIFDNSNSSFATLVFNEYKNNLDTLQSEVVLSRQRSLNLTKKYIEKLKEEMSIAIY
ncbi:polysaccharide pyruvyl transferase family protein [Vibrio furnissii]|uniref:polysaccharide pyruvyl transferase family protein n=1 Tax=Vibrio furnissii TaxID=29494 RepID=UPI001558741B|nr:polysaccharide pyruvyl transferase family protein [Vibrio furnissii]